MCSIRILYVISAILIYCTTYSCCVLYNYTDRKSTKCTKMGGGGAIFVTQITWCNVVTDGGGGAIFVTQNHLVQCGN